MNYRRRTNSTILPRTAIKYLLPSIIIYSNWIIYWRTLAVPNTRTEKVSCVGSLFPWPCAIRLPYSMSPRILGRMLCSILFAYFFTLFIYCHARSRTHTHSAHPYKPGFIPLLDLLTIDFFVNRTNIRKRRYCLDA